MTLLNTKDLKQIADILQWAKDKTVSVGVLDKINESHELVKRRN